ncbi:MAG: transcription antitermination factor NusB [Micrococcales bacterium]|nr:MAG: transcription antitermination factor NusB [Micrococcales bacterium]
MSARRKARKRALDLLFEAEQRDLDVLELVRQRLPDAQPPIPAYCVTLVEGVAEHREHIDELLSAYAAGWTLARMPAVDRALLRIGSYEILWAPDVPDAVAIDEAVALATSLSTDDSPGFINGLLARILSIKPQVLGT